MNKLLREEMEYLINCDDKSITPDVKDDVKMTLDYIDELEKENERLSVELNTCMIERNNLIDRIDKAIEYINKYEYQRYCPSPYEKEKYIMREEKEGEDLLDILRGEDNGI